ncbi:MAG: single-stranded-DNA-specific exonuclease [Clostridia bacterium]|jgi:single-stranded-DNA-specific exonuclease|nr:single-stranded-DNA-specific exonuclease [Clostridia bacterium]MDN5323195.1 single-stranded-DNA-specific exonuclease [Clostridia bacterium]
MVLTKKKIWNVQKIKSDLQERLVEKLNISPTLAILLINRGYHDEEAALNFLYPSLKDLSSPFILNNVRQAVDRIKKAINNQEKIVVYGDYDVDGITSTTLLTEVLRSIGADVNYYIPDRIEEGYGLNIDALEQLSQNGVQLIITVDCGISAKNEVIVGQSLGLEFIITDHHQPPAELPPCIVINPALEQENVPWKDLAGVGVAYKLAQGLLETFRGQKEGQKEILNYLDLAALGTIADIVPLMGENRIIVKYGLEQIISGNRLGIKALCKAANIDLTNITSTVIGYFLAPRLNACGRIGDANLGVRLLLTSNEIEASQIAQKLNNENQKRQTIENKIIREAMEMVEELDLSKEKVIVLTSKDWHQGVIGIVASRLVEKYYRPTIILTLQNNLYKGSGRSIPGFHLYQALSQCHYLLENYGGHSQAAGLSLLEENIPEFKKRINIIADASLCENDFIPALDLDGEINLETADFTLLEEITKLEPFGCANPEPLLIYRQGEVQECREVGNNGGHLKLKIKAGSSQWDAIGFNMSSYLEMAASREPLDLAFTLDKNHWNGKTNLQLVLKDLKPSTELDNPNEPLNFLDRLFFEGPQFLEEDVYKDINSKGAFYTKVVGVTYENRQALIRMLKKDDSINLVREHGNIYDPNAIAVYVKDEQIGYLKKELAKHLAQNIDKGIRYCGYIAQITGGEAKNLGVNIYLKKDEKSDKDNFLNLKILRKELSSLNTSELMNVIKKAVIGDHTYRSKQVETLECLANGYNTLGILGTGRGKSAIFQTWAAFLALSRRKITIIIYPLRSLVNDQFISLKNKLAPLGLNVFKATGSLEPEERLELFTSLERGDIDIILTTPEFLYYNKHKFQALIDVLGLVVIDECHHLASRRQGYKLLPQVLKELSNPRLLLVTATADDNISKVILEKLNIEKIVIDPHVRDNLILIDERGCNDKIGYIKKLLDSGERTVVYVNSRKIAYNLARDLRRDIPWSKDKIAYYHGGLSSDDRQGIEEFFRQGSLQLIITTSAFGEGIDIPDIENVVLYHLCFSKEEYNQLAGRAGRNGEKAKIHLLYGTKDKELNQLLLAGTSPDREQLAKFYLLLKKLAKKSHPITFTNSQLAEWANIYKISGVQDKNISIWLGILEELGIIEREIEGNTRNIYIVPNPPKVNLEDSLRYLEGIEEKNNFEEYVELAFQNTSQPLLELINRPIYPTKIVIND